SVGDMECNHAAVCANRAASQGVRVGSSWRERPCCRRRSWSLLSAAGALALAIALITSSGASSASPNAQWNVASLSEARAALAAGSVGTRALFAGGMAGDVPSGAVDVYDAASGQWTTAALSQARWPLAAATVGTKALFAGGVGTNGPSSAVDIYDAASGQ